VSWLLTNFGQVWSLAVAHIGLSIPPIIVGFVVSLPIGWLANRFHASRGTILAIVGILYAIPSLPLFVFMPALIGTSILSPLNVIVALSIYALALMVRTTADALASVPKDVLQSATAMGYSSWQRFWRVELPLAGPVLLAGVRVVSVSTISLVSIGSVIGVSSLGYLFLDSFYRDFPTEALIGIVAIMIIALVFDFALVLLGRALLPWARRVARPGRSSRHVNQPALQPARTR
jgi:osmoprotectant transport system permease protein